MKTLGLFCLLFSLPGSLCAQWIQTNGPEGGGGIWSSVLPDHPINCMAFYPLLIFAGGGVWRRSLHDLHAFHLSIDSLVLKKVADDADSLFVECDTTWIIRGSMPEYLSGGPLSGSGDSYVMFQTLQENPYDEDRMNEFTLVSSRGDSVGFLVIQSGKNSGIPENGSPDLLVSVR